MSDDIDDLLEVSSKQENPKVEKPKAEKSGPSSQAISPGGNIGAAALSSVSSDVEITYSPSRVSNYATLKNIAKGLKLFAQIVSLGGVLAFIVSVISIADSGDTVAFWIFIGIGVFAFFIAMQMSLFSEGVNVILDIEANSRQSAKTLERILKSK